MVIATPETLIGMARPVALMMMPEEIMATVTAKIRGRLFTPIMVGLAGIVDALEVNGQVVDDEEEGAAKEEGVNAADPDRALLEQARYYQGPLVMEVLPGAKHDQDNDEADNQADHVAAVPRLGLLTVL